jgi:hypothetical protein
MATYCLARNFSLVAAAWSRVESWPALSLPPFYFLAPTLKTHLQKVRSQLPSPQSYFSRYYHKLMRDSIITGKRKRAPGDEEGGENKRARRTNQPDRPLLPHQQANSDHAHETHRHLFEHQPLDLNSASIRLVGILPLSSEGTVRCTVTHEKLRSTVQYTCLSYVWGSEEDLEWIDMNGRSFQVTRNLYQFLLVISTLKATLAKASTTPESHLLELDKMTKYLWIDALCINQTAVRERNHQVQQMGHIYSRAKMVISWLGNDPEIASFFKLAREINFWSTLSNFHPPIMADYIEQIVLISSHIYWTRAWVTQEVILAQRLLLLAATEIVWLEALQTIGTRAIWYEKALGSLRTHEELWKPICALMGKRRESTLLENLWHFRNKKCADERDLVYSILSISGKDKIDASPTIRVDYTRCRSELAHEVLFAHKPGTCLCSVAITLQVLRLDAEVLSNEESTRALLRLSRWHAQGQKHFDCAYYCNYCVAPVALNSKGKACFKKWVYIHCLGCRHHTSIRLLDHLPYRYGHLVLEATAIVPTKHSQWKLFYVAPATGTRTMYRDFTANSGIRADMTTNEVSLTLSIGEVAKLLRLTPVEDILRAENIEQTCEMFDSREEHQLVLAGHDAQDPGISTSASTPGLKHRD